MASFFEFNKSKLLEMKMKFNNYPKTEKSDDQQQAQASNTSNPFITPASDLPPVMSESWVDIAPSRTSLCSSVEILMADEKDKDSRLSPISIQSPHVEFESLEQVKYRLVREMLPPGKNTDWMWDWSSRPEYIPPKTLRMRQYGSNLTTPPNSPEPDLANMSPFEESIFSVRAVFGFLVSNFFSFVIGAAVG
ncbi:unnamed protein product [Caenorhabditis bovis]|uniref:Uncharacterized protein n=1 Tax=Caenorhabditis bovis TaxID=2654633 RepID=A0A8S1EBX0_9PELO|nr:unnamed protein product [Caenorhabditis bovis]